MNGLSKVNGIDEILDFRYETQDLSKKTQETRHQKQNKLFIIIVLEFKYRPFYFVLLLKNLLEPFKLLNFELFKL